MADSSGWDDPDALASHIMHAFDNGQYAEVSDAAAHLLKIDTIPERAVCLYTGCLLETEQYAKAETHLLDYLKTHPKHAYVLKHLAKAQDALDKKEEAFQTLEEALSLDPNQEDALTWWHSLKEAALLAEGVPSDEAALQALRKGNKKFGGWRSKFLLGSHYLSEGDHDTAFRYYNVVLRGNWTPEALTLLSMALLQYGLVEDMVALIAPHYNPAQHEPMTGFHLLHAYLQLEEIAQGQALLHALGQLHQPELAEQLDWFASEFLNLMPGAEPEPTIPEEIISEEIKPLDIKLAFIDYPLWCYGWNIQHGFDQRQTKKKVAFFQFAAEQAEAFTALDAAPTDTLGRLTFALPLFFLEDVYYGTHASATFLLPLNQDTGAGILYSDLVPKEEVMQLSKEGYDYAVTGIVCSNQFRLTVWDLEKQTAVNQTFLLDLAAPNTGILKAEAFLFESMDITFDTDFKQNKRGFKRLPAHQLHDYLMHLSAQLFMYQVMKFPQLLDALADESQQLRQIFQAALQTEHLQLQLHAISTIHMGMRYDSAALKAHQTQVLQWLNQLASQKHVLHKIAKKTAEAFQQYCATRQHA